MRLRALAPGKVNLCLFLGAVRPDGRHELVTLLESVSLADELELTTLGDRDRLADGAAMPPGADVVCCPGVQGPNLAARALQELRRRGWGPPAVRVEIGKRVPVAAGMGGGSADAAAVLRLACALELVAPEVLLEIALGLGTDVPSQLEPGLALGTGAGEIVAPLDPLASHALLIVPQGAALSTPDVYREADRLGLGRDASDLDRRRAELVAALGPGARLGGGLLVNDLQPAALSLCPQIEGALQAVLQAGAQRAMVCGSGPTVAGVYWGDDGQIRAAAGAEAIGRRFSPAYAVVPVPGGFGFPVRA